MEFKGVEIPGFTLTTIRKHLDFALIAIQNPIKELFVNKRLILGKKFITLVCSRKYKWNKSIVPVFVNIFDITLLEGRIKLIKLDKKKLIKFLLINFYKENKVKT